MYAFELVYHILQCVVYLIDGACLAKRLYELLLGLTLVALIYLEVGNVTSLNYSHNVGLLSFMPLNLIAENILSAGHFCTETRKC